MRFDVPPVARRVGHLDLQKAENLGALRLLCSGFNAERGLDERITRARRLGLKR